MVWFTFTFLLGIPNDSNPSTEGKKNNPLDKSQVEKNYVEIDVSKPTFSCHIEYTLFPNQPQKFIDVVCWKEVAKIYFENSASAIKPLVVDKIQWIHFRVNHKMKLATREIPVFLKHVVKVGVIVGNKKMGDKARSDHPKKFYALKFSEGEEQFIKRQLFQPLSESSEDLEAISFLKKHFTPKQQLYISLDTTIETSEHFNLLYKNIVALSDEYSNEEFQKIPSPLTLEPPPIRNLGDIRDINASNISYKKEKSIDKKKEKSIEKRKENTYNAIQFSVSGEEFLSGKNILQNCVKYNSEDLPYVFNLIKVTKVLSPIQAEYFNPLSVSLKHCGQVPDEDLRKHGITVLKFQYTMCDKFLVESNLIPIEKSMKLNYVRTILTNEIDKNQLIYFLQTGGLKIHVFGNLSSKKKAREKSMIYDREEVAEKSRAFRKNKAISNDDELVLLGTAFADLSPILLQPHRVLLKCNLQIPPDCNALNENQELKDAVAIYEFYSYRKNKIHLKSFNFSIASTVLTLSVQMCYPLTKVYQNVLMNPFLLNRLFAVIYDTSIAISILQIIQNQTNELLDPVNYCKFGLNVKRPLTKYHKGSIYSLEASKKTQMTGFLINCINKILIFVEGSLYGSIQQIWAVLSCMKPQQGHVLYDSSLVFTERLYSNFFKCGDFLKVNLQMDLETCSKSLAHYKVFTPKLAWDSMICLNRLIYCKSIKTASQNNLFPDSESLRCMAIEFGIPIQMCEKNIICF